MCRPQLEQRWKNKTQQHLQLPQPQHNMEHLAMTSYSVLLDIWYISSRALPNDRYDTEWREHNNARSRVVSVASMPFRFLAQLTLAGKDKAAMRLT